MQRALNRSRAFAGALHIKRKQGMAQNGALRTQNYMLPPWFPGGIRHMTVKNAFGILATLLLAACASGGENDAIETEEAELNQVFRSAVQDRGPLAMSNETLKYPEDARPFRTFHDFTEPSAVSSRYVGYTLIAKKGDGLLFAAESAGEGANSECKSVVRTWIVDSSNRVVSTGTRACEQNPEEGPQAKSKILRHYFDKSGTYRLIVSLVPASTASRVDAVRTSPWSVWLDVVQSSKADQGKRDARCQDGVDILCEASLKCERARCKTR
jgi:hypothetical protein